MKKAEAIQTAPQQALNIISPLRDDGCNKVQLLDCDFNLIDEVVAQNGL